MPRREGAGAQDGLKAIEKILWADDHMRGPSSRSMVQMTLAC